MFDTFTEQERKWLTEPCGFWFGRLETKDLNKIIRKILDVFYQWRDEQADKKGMVKVQASIGILSALQTKKTFPVEDMAPW